MRLVIESGVVVVVCSPVYCAAYTHTLSSLQSRRRLLGRSVVVVVLVFCLFVSCLRRRFLATYLAGSTHRYVSFGSEAFLRLLLLVFFGVCVCV